MDSGGKISLKERDKALKGLTKSKLCDKLERFCKKLDSKDLRKLVLHGWVLYNKQLARKRRAKAPKKRKKKVTIMEDSESEEEPEGQFQTEFEIESPEDEKGALSDYRNRDAQEYFNQLEDLFGTEISPAARGSGKRKKGKGIDPGLLNIAEFFSDPRAQSILKQVPLVGRLFGGYK